MASVRRASCCLAVLFFFSGFVERASATPIGWTCFGSCGTSGADGVVTAPPSSSTYEWISTNGGLPTFLLNLILNPPPPNLAITQDGTVLRSNAFAAGVGDRLDFDFNFITSDGDLTHFLDYAWARVLSGSSVVAYLFTARTNSVGDAVPGEGLPVTDATVTPPNKAVIPGAPTWSPLGADSGKCFGDGCGYTDWMHSRYTFATAGNFVLEFGVLNFNDDTHDSGLAFNGTLIPFTPGPGPGPGPDPGPGPGPNPNAVREPSTFALVGTAVAAAMARRRGVRR